MTGPAGRPGHRSRDNAWMACGGWPGRRLIALGACLMVAVAGCTPSEDSGQRAGPPSSVAPSTSITTGDGDLPSAVGSVVQLSCGTSILAEPDVPEHYRVVLPGVAVPAGPVLDASETGEAGTPTRWFAKWGLVVRTGTVVDLELVPGWEDRARILWGSSAEPGSAVHVPACPAASGQAQWLHFTGGTWVAQPACVPMLVRSQAQEEQVLLGIGTACVGGNGP
jgi:hypothetical protein